MTKSEKLSDGEAFAALRWQLEAGADEAISETVVNRFESGKEAVAPEASKAAVTKAESKKEPTAASVPAKAKPAVNDIDAAKACAKAKNLEDLKAVIEAFEGCNLKRTAMNTVFSDGNPEADLMFVGEAPGADEDRQGKPFVGASGQLLDRMMAAVNMTRAEDYYISNILPWRPPGNRKPTPVEVTICLPFILRHLELAKPKIVVLLGATAASALLDTNEGITKIRGRWREMEIGGKKVPVMPTYHPAYLLRQPRVKRDSWRDVLEIRSKLESAR